MGERKESKEDFCYEEKKQAFEDKTKDIKGERSTEEEGLLTYVENKG